jgi:SSS family solute:Na+ symporter
VSTISTHLNWGTSYLVHDLYRRFVRPGATERHYVAAGRVTTALLMLLAALLTFVLDSARQSFELLLSIGAGTGLIYLLRWFWWRINAWSEISAMVSSFVVAVGFFVAGRAGAQVPSHIALLLTVGATSVVWIAVTLLTRPTDRATLVRFYQQVRPAGPGWRPVRAAAALAPSPDSLPQQLLAWTAGCVFVYSALFAVGNALYGRTALTAAFSVAAAASGVLLYRLMRAMFRAEELPPGSERDALTTAPPRERVPTRRG